jgi:hypothetical protein
MENPYMIDAELLIALKELCQIAGSYFVLVLLCGYLIKRLIDNGYELHLKPSAKRRD